MTLPRLYPPADHTSQWFGDRSPWAGGASFTTVEKLLLHTTETREWPSYPNFAPTLTYDPWTHQWRQHLPLTRSATTLADPSWTGVRENRDHVIQVEIVAYCDPVTIRNYGHDIHKIDKRATDDLGKFAKFLHQQGGLVLASSVPWVDYPRSAGLKASQRLSGPEFDAYKGILGHQHASGNEHGDPGKINIAAIIETAHRTPLARPAWSGELWVIKPVTGYNGMGRAITHKGVGVKLSGVIDGAKFNDGRYFCVGTKPHRVWYPVTYLSHDKGGKPIGN